MVRASQASIHSRFARVWVGTQDGLRGHKDCVHKGGWFPLAPAVLTNDGVAFRLRGELGCQGIDPFRGSHEREGKPVSLSSDRE